MILRRLVYLVVFSISLFPLLVHGQSLKSEINTILSDFTGNNKPGCAIAILKDNQVIYSEGHGLANLEHHIAFTPKTVSDIGSVAKQITCFATLLLEAEGKLALEDSLHQYIEDLPEFESPILIKHLMTHTSGLREIYASRAVAGGRDGDGILQSDAQRLVQYSNTLNFTPGTQYNYCNTAYMLLADIITAVSGEPFESFLQSRIFKPLGMNETYVMDIQGEWFHNNADSYRTMEDGSYKKIFDNSTVQGAGGIYTSLEDMTKWLQNYTDLIVGSPEIIAKMRTPTILNDGAQLNYGLGLQINDFLSLNNFRHSGSSAGYRAYLGYFDESKLGILIKTNQGEIPVSEIVELVLKEFADPVIPEQAGSPENSDPAPSSMTDADLSKFEGQYYCPELEMTYHIKVEDVHLVISSLRNGDIRLNRNGQTDFSSDTWYLKNIQFIVDSGQVKGFRLDNGRVMNMLFTKVDY